MWFIKLPLCLLTFSFWVSKVFGIFRVGGYILDDSCSFVGGLNSQATILEGAILTMRFSIRSKVLIDVKKGTASEHGYTAFFKTDDNKEKVTSVYRKLLAGGGFQDRCEITPSENITFSCPEVSAYDPNAFSCARTPHMKAFVRSDRSWNVQICPSWFSLPKIATAALCPAVVENKMTETQLGITQVGVLIHEISHLYGADAFLTESCTDLMNLSSFSDANETYNAQACAELPADQQVLNANNYALYAGGGFMQSLTMLVSLMNGLSCRGWLYEFLQTTSTSPLMNLGVVSQGLAIVVPRVSRRALLRLYHL